MRAIAIPPPVVSKPRVGARPSGFPEAPLSCSRTAFYMINACKDVVVYDRPDGCANVYLRRCRSAWCPSCAPVQRSASVAAAAERLLSAPGRDYLVTFTPLVRVTTFSAFADFVADVRRAVRDTVDAGRWDGAVCVVESTPRRFEWSLECCPFCTEPTEAAVRVLEHRDCPVCYGLPFPVGHVHVHALVRARPFRVSASMQATVAIIAMQADGVDAQDWTPTDTITTVGVDVQVADGDVSSYVSKLTKYVSKVAGQSSDGDVPWFAAWCRASGVVRTVWSVGTARASAYTDLHVVDAERVPPRSGQPVSSAPLPTYHAAVYVNASPIPEIVHDTGQVVAASGGVDTTASVLAMCSYLFEILDREPCELAWACLTEIKFWADTGHPPSAWASWPLDRRGRRAHVGRLIGRLPRVTDPAYHREVMKAWVRVAASVAPEEWSEVQSALSHTTVTGWFAEWHDGYRTRRGGCSVFTARQLLARAIHRDRWLTGAAAYVAFRARIGG